MCRAIGRILLGACEHQKHECLGGGGGGGYRGIFPW